MKIKGIACRAHRSQYSPAIMFTLSSKIQSLHKLERKNENASYDHRNYETLEVKVIYKESKQKS